MENTTHTNADQTAQTTSPPPSIKDAPLQRVSSVKSDRSFRNTNDVPISTSPEKRVTIRSARLNRDSLPASYLHGEPILGSENAGHPKPLNILQCLKLVLFSSKINVLLIFIPLGIVSGHVGWSDVTVFILNFIAIIPLAKRKYYHPPSFLMDNIYIYKFTRLTGESLGKYFIDGKFKSSRRK
jgi:Ca2+:H+ antiporter